MKELYELREKLCDELKGYGKKELSAGSLDVVDKLAHTVKNLDKIIGFDGEYSGYVPRSYAQRRDGRGRYSTDGYSYHDNMVGELEHLMEEAKDERTKQEFRRFINKLESM